MSATVVAENNPLYVEYGGGRQLTLRYRDLEPYRGKRAQRGKALPRNWRNNIIALRSELNT